MKNIIPLRTAAVCSTAFVCLLLQSCTKDAADSKPHRNALSATSSLTTAVNGTAILPAAILRVYSVRGSRTVYEGQANPHGSNVYLHLDYRADKRVSKVPGNSALTCRYGDERLADQGWKYLITGYNRNTGAVTLAPNAVMAAAIVPNSFETREATYDPRAKVFSFRTRYTSPEDGNETEIFEVLTAE